MQQGCWEVVLTSLFLKCVLLNAFFRVQKIKNNHLLHFQDAESGIYKQVWDKIISKSPHNLIQDPIQGISKAKTERFIFISGNYFLY